MQRLTTLVAALMVAAATLLPVHARAQAEPPNPLTTLKRLKCRFPTASAAAWKSGDPQVQIKTQELLFEITNIDVQDGTAEYLRWPVERDHRVCAGGVAEAAEGCPLTPRLPADDSGEVHC